MPKNPQESPIFVKTYDFLLWLIPLTLKYPKSQRFLLAEKLSKLALDFYDTLIEAATQSQERPAKLAQADQILLKIRFYLRLSHDLTCISTKQYEHATRLSAEIGRLLGGWQKSLNTRR